MFMRHQQRYEGLAYSFWVFSDYKIDLYPYSTAFINKLLKHPLPHSDARNADARISCIFVAASQNTNSQAFELLFDVLIDGAVLALHLTLKWFSRPILAQYGPSRILIADFIIGSDELPFCGATKIDFFTVTNIVLRLERDTARNEGCNE